MQVSQNCKKILKWIIVSVVFSALAFLYIYFDPANSSIFPKCPLYSTTGIKCPGCGSQRALHQLVHFEVVKAFKLNPLLVLSLPYLLIAAYLDLKKNKNVNELKLRNVLFGVKTTYFIFVIVVLYWIFRNIFSF